MTPNSSSRFLSGGSCRVSIWRLPGSLVVYDYLAKRHRTGALSRPDGGLVGEDRDARRELRAVSRVTTNAVPGDGSGPRLETGLK